MSVVNTRTPGIWELKFDRRAVPTKIWTVTAAGSEPDNCSGPCQSLMLFDMAAPTDEA